jgi:hypothetical protein
MRWWWYDDKGTRRLQLWVAQWLDNTTPFGCVILPRILLEDSSHRYVGLPVCARTTALAMFRDAYEEADVLVGHNVRGFDYATINGEMLIAGLPPLSRKEMHDTLRDQRRSGGQSRSLGNLLPRVGTSADKPSVHPSTWESAFNDYEPDALREVWNRCVADVMGHYELHTALRRQGWLKPARKGT